MAIVEPPDTQDIQTPNPETIPDTGFEATPSVDVRPPVAPLEPQVLPGRPSPSGLDQRPPNRKMSKTRRTIAAIAGVSTALGLGYAVSRVLDDSDQVATVESVAVIVENDPATDVADFSSASAQTETQEPAAESDTLVADEASGPLDSVGDGVFDAGQTTIADRKIQGETEITAENVIDRITNLPVEDREAFKSEENAEHRKALAEVTSAEEIARSMDEVNAITQDVERMLKSGEATVILFEPELEKYDNITGYTIEFTHPDMPSQFDRAILQITAKEGLELEGILYEQDKSRPFLVDLTLLYDDDNSRFVNNYWTNVPEYADGFFKNPQLEGEIRSQFAFAGGEVIYKGMRADVNKKVNFSSSIDLATTPGMFAAYMFLTQLGDNSFDDSYGYEDLGDGEYRLNGGKMTRADVGFVNDHTRLFGQIWRGEFDLLAAYEDAA